MDYEKKKVLVVGMARSGVAAAQLLRAGSADDCTTVIGRGQCKGNAAWHVVPDIFCQYSPRSPVCRYDQVYAGVAASQCQHAYRLSGLFGRLAHQVGQLVYNDDDLWHFLLTELERFVVAPYIAYSLRSKYLIAPGHLSCDPVQSAECFLSIRNHRADEMRDIIVYS